MPSVLSSYPAGTGSAGAGPVGAGERDAWIIARRGPRNALDPLRPYSFLVESERSADGEIIPSAAVFLTNRECPWRCVMCDLWRNTLTETVPQGAIAQQIRYALERLPAARQIKLYNSGSFFDVGAIPAKEHPEIASLVAGFERVIVECHPALVNERCVEFRDRLEGRLEVAMGLETAHPETLARLNKRMTLDQFKRAAEYLRSHAIGLRAFILVKPPFMRAEDALEWTARSLDFAFGCGATAVSLIPTRGGNGAMEELAAAGEFSPPDLAMLETAAERGIALNRGRVFADLWALDGSPGCNACREKRVARLRTMNLEQAIPSRVECAHCAAEA
jgi:archaeosine synthase beta-subunit